MWMDDDDGAPTQNPFSMSPSNIMFETESQSVIALIGVASEVTNRYKVGEKAPFCIADLNIGDGQIAWRVVDEYRAQCAESARPVAVSGFDMDTGLLEKAESALAQREALGILRPVDITTTPGVKLRNSLECGAGADIVLYAHAAYPRKLESSKLPRMVDRLGDLVLEKGAIITLHNYGPADIDDIRSYALGLMVQPVAGAFCNTHGRLEQSFQQSHDLHSFSVTVPNTIALPANMQAVNAIFADEQHQLDEKNAEDAASIYETLTKLVGGGEHLRTIIQDMDRKQKAKAIQYFERRITQAGGNDLPITVGGGQMIMAFKSSLIAQEAFIAINDACQQMPLPAIALPISSSVMPEFDKDSAHGIWAAKLQQSGISPPHVHQVLAKRS